ncbi:hypothetical protein K0651_01790 [Ornithinimicrobium sp. Arc0846-15]|nr:hypothetical protein [Ornithinimicrobium laminariae]
MPQIILREEWGAVRGDGWSDRPVPVTTLHLHHSDTRTLSQAASLVEDVEQILFLERVGWERFRGPLQDDGEYMYGTDAGVSYTWLVSPSGRIFEGRDLFGWHFRG